MKNKKDLRLGDKRQEESQRIKKTMKNEKYLRIEDKRMRESQHVKDKRIRKVLSERRICNILKTVEVTMFKLSGFC